MGTDGLRFLDILMEGIIALILRTDNCVKNKLYSKLRKAMKFINDSIQTRFRKRFKPLKVTFIYKMIEMADEKYKTLPAIKK